jgi:hypothetical protein
MDILMFSSIEKRFWLKVNKNGPIIRPELGNCWIWGASKNSQKYGTFRVGHSTQLAHRISFYLSSGYFPTGRDVLHICDNPSCVNPAHLFLGDDLSNALDRKLKGRNNSEARRGSNNGRSKLTIQDVLIVKHLLNEGSLIKEIASMFEVDRKTIYDIRSGKNWGYL